jgi:hypothetical protein
MRTSQRSDEGGRALDTVYRLPKGPSGAKRIVVRSPTDHSPSAALRALLVLACRGSTPNRTLPPGERPLDLRELRGELVEDAADSFLDAFGDLRELAAHLLHELAEASLLEERCRSFAEAAELGADLVREPAQAPEVAAQDLSQRAADVSSLEELADTGDLLPQSRASEVVKE